MANWNKKQIFEIINAFKQKLTKFLHDDLLIFGYHTTLISHLIKISCGNGYMCYPEALKTDYHEYRQNSLVSKKETGYCDLAIIKNSITIFLEVETWHEIYNSSHINEQIKKYEFFLRQHPKDLPSGLIFFYIYRNQKQKMKNYWNTMEEILYQSREKDHLKESNFFISEFRIFYEEKKISKPKVKFKL